MALQKYQTPKLSEDSVMNACKDPVLKLNETFGKVFYNSSVVTGVHNKCCFKVSIQVNGKYFSATGTTLKLAKQSCALAALADFCKVFYDVSVPVSSVNKLYKDDALIQHKKENVTEYIVESIQKHKTTTADVKKKKMSILGAIQKNEPLTIEEITDDRKQDQKNSPRKPKVLQNIKNFITKTNSNLKFPAMKSCLKYPASSNFKVDCKTVNLSSENQVFKDVSDKIHLSSDLGCMLSNKLMARQVCKKTIKAQKVSTVDVGNVQTLEMKLCIKSFARNPIHIDDPQTTLIEEIVNENVNHEQQVSLTQKKRRRDDSPESNELPAAKRLATYESKIAGQFNRKNRCQQNANVLANLEKLYSNLEFTLEAEMGSLLVPYFMVSAMVGRRKFFGHGKTKQLAQKDSATQILKYLETNPNEVNDIAFRPQPNNTNTYEMSKNPKNIENSSMQLPSYFADIIEAKIMNKFEELTSGRQEIREYKVLAGVVMTFNMNFEQAEVVSIATGTKCINGGNICCNGSVLNDSHAEIIAKRCLMKFLYTQLKWHCNLNSMGESIFQRNPNGLNIPYSLKPNIRFHLYINTAPCGDARIFCFSSNNNNNNIRQTSFNSGQYGQLRTKVEGDSGTTPVGTRYYPQTWDGVVLGEPLLTMSCSDKIARWNVVGLQGALLSQLVEPIYFHSIVLGSMFNGEHLYRGICGRIENYLGHLPLPYRLNRPLLGRTSRPLPRNTNKPPSIGINWTLGDDDIEIISLPTGRRIYNGISFLSKQTFFYKFNYLCNNLPNIGCASMCNNYAEAKENSKDFQIAKNELIAAFYRASLGTWVRKPIEQNAFMMNMS